MPVKKIAIVTDSTCDIPQDLIEQYQVIVQPHVIIWGENQYRDRVDLMPEEFYRRLRSDQKPPTTSQAIVQDWANTYRLAFDCGAEEAVVIVVSGQLSGALQSAKIAAGQAEIPVHVYDSRGTSLAMGWQVLAAARARETGGGVAEMLNAADSVRQKVHLVVYLDTLYYAYRSGRIGNLRRLIGAMLKVKPLLCLDLHTGLVGDAGMTLTRRLGLEYLYQQFFHRMDGAGRLRLGVLHGDAEDDAAVFLERVGREHSPIELITNITCPALGAYTGPRAIALCGYGDGLG